MFLFLKNLFTRNITAGTNPSPPVISEVKKTTDPESLQIEAIKRYRQEMFTAFDREIETQQASVTNHKARIASAEHFMKETGLAYGIASMMTTCWVWNSDARKASEECSVPVEHGVLLTGGGDLPHNGFWVSFKLGANDYRIELRPEQNFLGDSDYRYAKATITCASKLVLAVDLRQHYNAEYFQWDYTQVTNLEKLGSWLGEMVELTTKIELKNERLMPDTMIAAIKHQAEGLPPT